MFLTRFAQGFFVLTAAIMMAVFSGCGAIVEPADEDMYRAEIVRTSHGVAHVTADDFGSLGYGEGYAAAEDHICNIAYGLLEARGELASELGAGDSDKNVISDGLVSAIDLRAQAQEALAAQGKEISDWLEGYAAGYNRFVRERGASETAWCAGAPWVREVTTTDFTARMLLMIQTIPQISAAIAAAQPPPAASGGSRQSVSDALIADAADAVALSGMGSNAWAFGAERTENGLGLLLANPHYPWYGSSRFWEKHLTIPGRLDVYGTHLLGSPGVAIGFNRNVAWTHTVSDSQRLVFYRLELLPDDPLRYRYGEEVRAIRAQTVTVKVRQEDAKMVDMERTFWFSHYGPMVAFPGMDWSERSAFTVRDANARNHRVLSQWLDMNQSVDLDEFIEAHRRWNSMPFVNTMAVSDSGRALYLDNSTVVDLSQEAIDSWRQSLSEDPLASRAYAERGWLLLNGSDSRFEWQLNNGAPIPGTVPFDHRPALEREDYIFNSNDSYWLTNPEQPLTGFSPLYGKAGTARSLRTRMNLRMLDPKDPYGHSGADGLFSKEEIQEALFGNRGLAAELLVDELVAACTAMPAVEWDGQLVDLGVACDALQNYDRRLNENSRGAVLFREWLARYEYSSTLRAGDLFAAPFDPDAPVSTPSGLGDAELAMKHLAAAIRVLEDADLPLDAALGEAQFAYRAGGKIPIHGGNRFEGVANLQVSGLPTHPVAGISAQRLPGSKLATSAGYPVLHGSSFIMALSFTDSGPSAEALLSYGQSGDPGSQYFLDQTLLYRDKQWRPVLFDRDAILADVQAQRELVGPR